MLELTRPIKSSTWLLSVLVLFNLPLAITHISPIAGFPAASDTSEAAFTGSPEHLRLRGGNDESHAKPLGNPRAWTLEDVLSFVESLRWKFGDRTDLYKTSP